MTVFGSRIFQNLADFKDFKLGIFAQSLLRSDIMFTTWLNSGTISELRHFDWCLAVTFSMGKGHIICLVVNRDESILTTTLARNRILPNLFLQLRHFDMIRCSHRLQAINTSLAQREVHCFVDIDRFLVLLKRAVCERILVNSLQLSPCASQVSDSFLWGTKLASHLILLPTV